MSVRERLAAPYGRARNCTDKGLLLTSLGEALKEGCCLLALTPLPATGEVYGSGGVPIREHTQVSAGADLLRGEYGSR